MTTLVGKRGGFPFRTARSDFFSGDAWAVIIFLSKIACVVSTSKITDYASVWLCFFLTKRVVPLLKGVLISEGWQRLSLIAI